MSRHALSDWYLNEEDALAQQMGNNSQAFNPDQGAMNQTQDVAPGSDPNVANMPQDTRSQPQAQEMPDRSEDPQTPDMPQDNSDQDFEQWKNDFFKQSIQGDTQKLLDLVVQVRDSDLDAYPRKFVEDNLQILFLRQNANIDKASTAIRKLIKEQLDQNNPSTSLVNHIFSTLGTMPELGNVFVKLKGLLGMKGDLHRKFIASLFGAIQVGSGGNNEDIVYNQKDFSVRISTRFNDRWGRVDLGKWCMKEDDPERFLSDPELKRLENGSPEEKEALKKRIVIESIAQTFKTRSFIINVTGEDGTVYTLGWDIAGSLKDAYASGKLVVKIIQSENSEAMLNDDGAIVPFVDIKIKYVKETGEVDEEGKPVKEEHDFMERIDGMLFLTAQLNVLKNAATSFQGITLKDSPYNGNPSDLKVLMRCVPSSEELLLRNC